jgi:glycerol-3-phosphate acyltransferase PlsX
MRIGIDAMGGDFAPLEAVLGSCEAARRYPHLHLLLYGNKAATDALLQDHGYGLANIEVIHCSEAIGMSEHAVKAITSKKDSSIVRGLAGLASGECDAFMGAGNTGAMYAASLFTVKPIEGVQRPCLTSILPKPEGAHGVLLDVGANADCKPEMLNQFAILGALYSQLVYHVDTPKVGLLNIGEEEEKGNVLTLAAHAMLKENKHINFVGNVEGRDIFGDKADVVVCDGFTGNVVVKSSEGLFYRLMKRGVEDDYLDKFNFRHYGGTPVLGVNKPVVIGHGISKADSFVKMVELCEEIIRTGLIEKIRSSFKEIQAAQASAND